MVFDAVDLLKLLHTSFHILQTVAICVFFKSRPFSLFPQIIRDARRSEPFRNTLHKIPHFRQVKETDVIHRLHQLASYAMFPQQCDKHHRFFICLCEHAGCTLPLIPQQVFHQRLIHLLRHMPCQFHPSLFSSFGDAWHCLHSPTNTFREGIGEIHHMVRTAEILRHFNQAGTLFLRELIQIS